MYICYYCACGNPVDDSDVVDSYAYDETTKTFTLYCLEETKLQENTQKFNADLRKPEILKLRLQKQLVMQHTLCQSLRYYLLALEW